MNTRKICIVTGTRAEYGLLKPLIDGIGQDGAFELQVVATGTHLSPEFGLTIAGIERDGVKVDEKIEMLLSSDTAVGVGKSMGLALIGFADALARLKPDVMVLLGDRYETLCAAAAALVSKVPIAHLHGGELTEGAFDESIRHAITKFSYLHFAATERYRRRIIQMGEAPERVFNVGAIGIDNINKLPLLDRDTLEADLGVKFAKQNVLVTFHPVTLDTMPPEAQVEQLLLALDEFPQVYTIFTKANADAGGRIINRIVESYVDTNSHRSVLFSSLGQLRYLSLMQMCDAVVGNSSSGIIEAPSLKVPTVNIGARQKGRERAKSVLDCAENSASIVDAVKMALGFEFQTVAKNCTNPYGSGGVAEMICTVLRTCPLEVLKPFYDVPL